jgi:hypothetical protein
VYCKVLNGSHVITGDGNHGWWGQAVKKMKKEEEVSKAAIAALETENATLAQQGGGGGGNSGGGGIGSAAALQAQLEEATLKTEALMVRILGECKTAAETT